MTDLTAAELVERLKDTTAESWRWELKAATLIEQQAEQIAGLVDESKQWPRLVDTQLRRAHSAEQKAADHYQGRIKAESEVAALRKMIEDAPHGDGCSVLWRGRGNADDAPCDCWKSTALPS